MKTKSISAIGNASLVAAIFLLAVSAQAGEPAATEKKFLVDEPAIANLIDPITGELSAGYDSIYMFRGMNLGEESPWVGAEIYIPLAFPAGNYTLTLGAWYINPTEPAKGIPGRGALDDELDLYASLSTTLGIVDVALIYYYYALGPDNATGAFGSGYSDQNEVGISFATTIGMIDLGFDYYYNFDAAKQGTKLGAMKHYFEPSIGTTFELCDYASLAIGAAAGFYSDEFSHVQYTAALPIRLSETLTVEPYVAYLDDQASGGLAVEKGSDFSDFFWGASMTVSF